MRYSFDAAAVNASHPGKPLTLNEAVLFLPGWRGSNAWASCVSRTLCPSKRFNAAKQKNPTARPAQCSPSHNSRNDTISGHPLSIATSPSVVSSRSPRRARFCSISGCAGCEPAGVQTSARSQSPCQKNLNSMLRGHRHLNAHSARLLQEKAEAYKTRTALHTHNSDAAGLNSGSVNTKINPGDSGFHGFGTHESAGPHVTAPEDLGEANQEDQYSRGSHKASRLLQRASQRWENAAQVDERVMYVQSLQTKLESASESGNQRLLRAVLRGAVAALSAPRAHSVHDHRLYVLDEAAQQRLQTALQTRLRKIIISCLSTLDLQDPRSLPATLRIRSLIHEFEARTGAEVSLAQCGKHWSLIKATVSDVSRGSGAGLETSAATQHRPLAVARLRRPSWRPLDSGDHEVFNSPEVCQVESGQAAPKQRKRRLCVHLVPLSKCSHCEQCRHGHLKQECRTCASCPHGRTRSACASCSGQGCVHGKLFLQCRLCSGCAHGKARARCGKCNGCPHGKMRSDCVQCVGCEHGRVSRFCSKCNACPHGKLRQNCGHCRGCPHGKAKQSCAQCVGCPHGYLKSRCRFCSGCPHGKLPVNCVTCRPCPHGRLKRHCQLCSPCAHGYARSSCAQCNRCPHSAWKRDCAICNPCEHHQAKRACTQCSELRKRRRGTRGLDPES